MTTASVGGACGISKEPSTGPQVIGVIIGPSGKEFPMVIPLDAQAGSYSVMLQVTEKKKLDASTVIEYTADHTDCPSTITKVPGSKIVMDAFFAMASTCQGYSATVCTASTYFKTREDSTHTVTAILGELGGFCGLVFAVFNTFNSMYFFSQLYSKEKQPDEHTPLIKTDSLDEETKTDTEP